MALKENNNKKSEQETKENKNKVNDKDEYSKEPCLFKKIIVKKMIKDEEIKMKKKIQKEIIEKKQKLNQTLDFNLVPIECISKIFC